ncbi:MAG: tRNA guanosine(34) transglycosylase Tgt [Dehalococcoidia bacterium]|nr:tRNA guanosine(34) transglycosylase Tgt [Dehalococcoidia bacterium]
MPDKTFSIINNCPSTSARTARLNTLHGEVQTPIFLPVGTQATVRAVTPDDLEEIGIRMILCNAYHLYLRPSVDVIEKAGGLHRFMAWDRPILTDSGGYQIFSLSSLRKVTDDGAVFRSHIDGSEHRLSPENVVALQEKLGSDIMMVLDVCPETTAKKEDLSRAVRQTTLWAQRCYEAYNNTGQLLFGIVQGGTDKVLRTRSASEITDIDFPGYAIGGLSLGESKTAMWEIVGHTVPLLPAAKPKYLMGIGAPDDILEGIARGIDIFDSALPTRVARNGGLYTKEGRKNVKRTVYSKHFGPLDESCGCYTCRNFSLAYLHHLFRCEELLAYRLATIHNLYFMNSLLAEVRDAVSHGRFAEFKEQFLLKYKPTDEDTRIEQKSRSLEVKRSKQGNDFQ